MRSEVISMNIDSAKVEAAFRWSVIAPLQRPGLSQEEHRLVRRDILARQHEHPLRGPVTVSPTSLRRWINAYRREGLGALAPRPRTDAGALKAFPVHVLERAIELRREAPRRTVKKLVELLENEFPDQRGNINRSTLDRHLRDRGWSRCALGTTAAPFISFEAPYRNALWTGDVLHGPEVLVEGETRRVKIFGWIDDWSRTCVCLRGYSDERLPALEDALHRAMLNYGVPERLFTDNGLVFSSVQLDLICASLGVEKVHSRPGYAPSRGKIERLFRTVRDQLLCEIEVVDPMPLDELNRYLEAWVQSRYNRIIHSRTGQAPIERWEGSDVPVRTASLAKLKEAFLHWARRKVGPTGEIKLAGNIYQADPTLAHQTVVVRYDPMNLSEVFLHGRTPMERLTTQRLICRQFLRAEKAQERRASRAARDYLVSLDRALEQQLTQELRLIRFRDLPGEEDDDNDSATAACRV